MDGAWTEDRECSRCGTLLGDDEGICPTCGTVFGRATIAMPALSRPPGMGSSPSSPAVDASLPGLDLPAAPVDQTPMMPPATVGSAKGSNTLLWVLAGIIALLAVVLIAITLSILMN